MSNRLLIVSTLDSDEPFGAFTRPFYLGKYLSSHYEICHLGLNCSAVDYAESISINQRSLTAYIKALQNSIREFKPDIVYAQETLPGLSALIVTQLKPTHKYKLVFDFHTLSAFEYATRLSSTANPIKEFSQLAKTYIAQGSLIYSGKPIIAASQNTIDLIPQWYKTRPRIINYVGNGVADDLLDLSLLTKTDPYQQLRPAKIVTVIAPKTYSFPTNDMSADLTVEVAKYIAKSQKNIHIVVIGRTQSEYQEDLPPNISFTGYLPERSDFLAYLSYADVGLLPFSKEAVAGGARNKALDFLASKNLVVSTPEGLRGLEEFGDRQHLLVSGYSVEEISHSVIDACQNLEQYQPLVNAAYQLIQKKYSWSGKSEEIKNIFDALLST